MKFTSGFQLSILLLGLTISALLNNINALTQEEVDAVVANLKEERNKFSHVEQHDHDSLKDLECSLDQTILDEIHSYQDDVNDIIELFTTGEFTGKTWDYLAEMTDTFGNRIVGSEALDNAIDWVVATATSEGMTSYNENVTAPFFQRNEESLKMISPRSVDMTILGIGLTVPTPEEGITADALVVSSFDELTSVADQAVGKIVVYDVPFTTYGETNQYRTHGAVEAARVGAVAALVRSIATFSINSPHTGAQTYSDSVPKIPSACITIEDATFLHRLQDRGETITLQLNLGAVNHENGTLTRNTIIEIEGSQNPEEVVVVSGHLDSWDVGVGAMDDAGGVFISWMALRAVQKLGLTPRRTYRAVLFTAEEEGIYGGDTGSQALEDAIDWIVSTASKEGMTVYTENVTAPYFIRNEESLRMISPRHAQMNLLGLGSTVPTPEEGITADALVVSSFDELTALADQSVGKIVVYDIPFTSYGESAQYRNQGAVEAARVGAVASLVRSVTPFSIDSPHTGAQFYSDSVPKIPAASITIEDSSFMRRLQERGERITLHLYLGAKNYENGTESRNTIIEIKGTQNPEEIVVVSGHLDSWDVGVGAMDDAGGCFISWMALRAVKKLALTPRRTYRAIFFTAEEQGIYGGYAYFVAHGTQKHNFQLMMESDFGTFKPHGIFFSGTEEASCMIKEIVSLTARLNTTEVRSPADTPDLDTFGELGVPRGSLINENDHYIWFHHSSGDRINVYDSNDLDDVAALWTAVSYVAADVTFRLPHANFNHTINIL